MKNGYDVEIIPNDHEEDIHDGLCIIARIIARDFMAKQALNGDRNNGGAGIGNLQNE